MALRHFYLEASLHAGAELILPQPLQHRLSGVLRMGLGDEVAVFNGINGLWAATITEKQARRVTLGVQLQPQPPMSGPTLVLGLPKREAWESALRQATELGVAAILPLATAFAQRDKLNAARAHTILSEAAEQSERLTLPTLHPVQTLPQWLATLKSPCVWADARGQGHPWPKGPTQVLVGPEGGFSPAEEEVLAAHPHITAGHLAGGILRTDTAVVAALTCVIN